MSKLIQRLLVFAIGLPAVLSIVYFLPFRHHLVANIAVICASGIGAVEFAEMLSRKSRAVPRVEAVLLGALLPIAATLKVSFGFSGEWELFAISAAALWILSSRVLSVKHELDLVAERVFTAFSILVYPGSFMLWIVRLNADPNATILLLLFLLMVFGNDSMAWAMGMAFGKGNRGIIPASPNKSLAGFIGGLATSVGLGIVAALLFPSVFPSVNVAAPLGGALLGFFCGLAAIVGDLAESAIKRSVDIKDSGGIIPGRGGLLDSIDSITFAAPVFLAAFAFLFRA